jgi:hypothetical protein
VGLFAGSALGKEWLLVPVASHIAASNRIDS